MSIERFLISLNSVGVDRKVLASLSCVRLFETPWTIASQALLSTGFPRQECWSGLLFSSPGDLSDPGIEPVSPVLAGGFFIIEPPGKSSGFNIQCN